MYLSKNASGTYYTRLPLPKSLRDRGLPFAIRTSLCTKDRQLAVDRNLAVAARTRALIAATPADTSPRSFYRWIRADLDAFKAAGFIPPQTPSTPREPSVNASACPSSGITLSHALARFIETKASEGIQHKTMGQLQLRINAFVTWAKGVKVDEVTPALAQEYRNILLRKSDISFKTKTDYLAALKQFFRWCVALDYCSRNPFDGLTAGKKPSKRADEERVRWYRPQLAQLFASLRSKQSQKGKKLKIQDWWLITSCRSANNIMPITIFLPAGTASFFYSA